MSATVPEPTVGVDLSTPDPIPEAAIERAVELMRTGRLHRYGEESDGPSEAAALEAEFGELVGRRYAVALSSGGSAIYVALRCAGVEPGDAVLVNAFTLAPVPGAIAHAGARAVLVEITEDLVVDLDDLERQAARGDARVLLLSHMRGHVADLHAVSEICARHGLTLIEDCAHTLGATWNGRATGTWGAFGCFSTQTFKHLNSGEGGLLACDDEEAAARATLLSGSYALHAQHGRGPRSEVLERLRAHVPNLSLRMSALEAALVRPQLATLAERIGRWNERHDAIVAGLRLLPELRLPRRPEAEGYVGSSLQFLVDRRAAEIALFVAACRRRGLHLKWFGAAEPAGYTSTYRHWRYLSGLEPVPRSDAVLARLCDMRIPSALAPEEGEAIVRVIERALDETRGDGGADGG